MQLKNGLLVALGATLAIGTLSFWYFREHTEAKLHQQQSKEEQLVQTLKISEGLLNRSHPMRALEVLRSVQNDIFQYPELSEEWLQLNMQIARALGDDRLLQSLYEYRPGLFSEAEDLSIRLAGRALLKRDLDQYDKLRSHWVSRSVYPHHWFILEADALTLKGHPEKALALLNSQTLQGENEVARLTRLALLNEKEHPKVSFEHLTKALKIDPAMGELHYFRGQLLEDTPYKDLAAIEYKEAIQNHPEDPFYKEELLRYYLKERKLNLAFELLQSSLSPPSNDKLWMEALFFNRMYKPVRFDFAQTSPPAGDLTPFIRYLLALPDKQLWNQHLLNSQPVVAEMAPKIPEALWIKTLSDLKNGVDIEAFKTLESNPQMANVQPELFEALQIALAYKLSHLKFTVAELDKQPGKNFPVHPVFKQLQQKPWPQDLERLMASKESFAALFLAAGWYEAAITLHQMPKIPGDFPKWVPYGMTQALAANRGNDAALKFASAQVPTAQLNLLISELDLKLGKYEEAIATLAPLASQSSDVGSRAAALLTTLYYDKHDLDRARQTVLSNATYASTLAGQEQLARIALKAGHIGEAEAIYKNILNYSSEAKSFFATKAYQSQDYKTALKLTQELSEQYPQRKELKSQISMIMQAMKGTKTR